MNINLGEKVKELRIAKSMTQSELAEKIGVTTSAVSSYEVSARQPSYDVLIKIAKLFNVTLDNLLGFGNKDFIDVTNLTVDQRNNIEEMVTFYKKFNALALTAFNLKDIDDLGISYLFTNSMESFEKELKKIVN